MQHVCPMCGSGTMPTTKESSVCLSCDTSVEAFKMVTIIRPRPAITR